MRTKAIRVFIIIGVTVIVCWAGAFLWFSFGSWPKTKKLKQFRDARLIPADAQEVFLEDDRGGFHGDGLTFLSYRCTEAEFNKFAKGPDKFLQGEWLSVALPSQATKTVNYVNEHFKIPESKVPQFGQAKVKWCCSEFQSKGMNHFGEIYFIDDQEYRVWYYAIAQ